VSSVIIADGRSFAAPSFVEGGVVRQARRSLIVLCADDAHPSVITEVHPLEAFGGSEGELRRFMTQFGYSARELQGEFSRDLLFQIEGSARAPR
jgi:hypothetical protein